MCQVIRSAHVKADNGHLYQRRWASALGVRKCYKKRLKLKKIKLKKYESVSAPVLSAEKGECVRQEEEEEQGEEKEGLHVWEGAVIC